MKHLPFIDALRGLAFLGVLLVHAGQQVGDFPGKALAVAGQHGVQLFFVASALTLCRSFDARRAERRPLANYFVRRLFRIAPLFWAGVVLYLLLYGVGPRYFAPDGVRAWHVLLTVLLVHGWHPGSFNNVVPGGWSIAVEVTFYLLLPFLWSRLRGLWGVLLLALLAAVVSVPLAGVVGAWLRQSMPPARHYLLDSFLTHWFPAQLGVFFLGVALYHALRSGRVTAVLSSGGRGLALQGLALLGYVVLALRSVAPLPEDFLYGLVAALLALGVALRPTGLLVNRWSCRLGDLSYSCYIVHFAAVALVGRLVRRALGPGAAGWGQGGRYLLVVLGGLLITVMAAQVTSRLLERPCMRLGQRLIRSWEAATRG